MLETIMKLILCIADIFMFCSFFQSLFKLKVGKQKYILYFGLGVCGIFGINSLGNAWINFFGLPILYIVFSVLLFHITLQKGIIYTIIYHIALVCGREMAFEMVFRYLLSSYPQLCELLFLTNEMIFYIVEYGFALLFLLYVERYTKKLELSEDSRGDWYLLIMPVASIMILFSFVYIEFPSEKAMQLLMCIGASLLYFSNAAIFVILANFSVAMNKAKLTELLLLKKDLDEVNFNNIEKANGAYRKCMHDIHHYFYQIRNLAADGQNERIMSIIDEIEGQIKDEERGRIFVGDSVLNAILCECYRKAGEYSIALSIFAEENIDVSFIQDTDKISLFGNTLDNAVEAAAKCADGNRKMEVRFFMGSQFILYLEIKNTWNGVSYKEDKKFLSTKKDRDSHGLGISIVEELAQKYKGNLELLEDDEWFITTLYLSNFIG